MFGFVSVIFIIVIGLLLLKKGLLKFDVKNYLATLSEENRNSVIPYLKGVFILGVSAVIMVWAVSSVGDLFINKFQQSKLEKIHAYKYIGYCYVDTSCRHIVTEHPVTTDEDVIKLTEEIRQYMIAKH